MASDQGWQYDNQNQNSGNHNKGGGPGLAGWIVAAVFLMCGLWPIGIILLIRNFVLLSKDRKDQIGREVRRAARDVGDAVRTGTESVRQWAAENASAKPSQPPSGKSTAPKKNTKTKPRSNKEGMGLIVGGGILSGIFGMGLMVSLVDNLQFPMYADYSAVIACALFAIGGLTMLFSGLGKRRRQEQYSNYLAYIGANREINLAHMAASFDVPVKKLCKDLRRMLAQGVLPKGYLDLAAGKLFLTEMGYRAPEPEPAKTTVEEEDAILREIRQVNDDIPDEVMSAKIDRIEEITGKILAFQKTHPEQSGQLRSFLNYYLPTTLKILRAYAQLDAQGIEGENITATKARIEGMMDQVVAGFEKQLDKLFQNEAMDISSDVQVLENMLKKDGLSGDRQTMTF